jgi:hypothetical protein
VREQVPDASIRTSKPDTEQMPVVFDVKVAARLEVADGESAKVVDDHARSAGSVNVID